MPISCATPVVFRAASSDPDNQSLTHLWVAPGGAWSGGDTLTQVLPNGTHLIGLIARDPDGKLDATSISYTRTCR